MTVTARRRILCCVLAASVGLFTATAPSTGGAADAPPSQAAMQALGLAKYYYGKGDFKEAAKLFHRAFAIDPRPEFLYNAARAEQRGAMLDDALKHYREVLRMKAVSPRVIQRTQLAIKEIEGVQRLVAKARAEGRRAEPAARPARPGGKELEGVGAVKAAGPAGAVTPTVVAGSGGRWKRSAAMPVLGGGVAVVAIGAYIALATMGEQADLDDRVATKAPDGRVIGIDKQTYKTEQERLNRNATISAATLGVGAVAVGVGAWMVATQPGAKVTLAPARVGPSGLPGLVLGGRL